MDEISAQQLLSVLMQQNGAELLWESWQNGSAQQALPGLFPSRPGREAGLLQEYIKGLGQLPPDSDLRLALLLLCFEAPKALAAVQALDLQPQSKARIMEALRQQEDFYFVDSIYKVKRFLWQYGEEQFQFLQRISDKQVVLHGHPEIRSIARFEYYMLIKKSKEPVYWQDMAIDEERLRALGLAEERIPDTLAALMDFVHRFPRANTESVLRQKAKNINSSPLIKLAKKFLGKY